MDSMMENIVMETGEYAEGRRRRLTGEGWGNWCLDLGTRELVHRKSRYAIDVERIYAPHDIYFWLVQLMDKTWVGAEDLGQLMFAFQDILTDLYGETLAYNVTDKDGTL